MTACADDSCAIVMSGPHWHPLGRAAELLLSESSDPRIARIERGIDKELWVKGPDTEFYALVARTTAALADLRAWQEIAERHRDGWHWCIPDKSGALRRRDCHDLQAADAALDRLDALWGTTASAD